MSLTGLVNKAGTEIPLTVLKADSVSYYAGVVTAINFGGWRIWGNYTGCFPGNSDPAYAFICCARMMDFLSNTFVNTFWSFIDRPMNRVLIDAIVLIVVMLTTNNPILKKYIASLRSKFDKNREKEASAS